MQNKKRSFWVCLCRVQPNLWKVSARRAQYSRIYMKIMSLRLEREDILSYSELVVDVLSVTLNHIVDDCYLWYWRWWPHRRQYSFCHSEPLVIGENPEQSQPSVYVQCLPSQSACDTSEWWEALFASDEKELKPKAAATETTTTATAYIIFFFILHCSKFVSSSTSKCCLSLKMYAGLHFYHHLPQKIFFLWNTASWGLTIM